MRTFSTSPIFIVGVGRSGTSLLQSMIASHPEIAMPRETSFFRRYVATRKLANIVKARGAEAARLVLTSDKLLSRVDVDIVGLFDDQHSSNAPELDAAVYDQLLQAVAATAGRTLVADKDPKAIENLHVLHGYWPDSRVLHIYRDPRDVLVSKKEAAWAKNRLVIRHVLAGAAQWKMSQAFKARVGRANYCEMKFEKLLESPDTELGRVCEWLGVEYRSEMLNFSATASRLVSEEEYAWKKETTGPLLKNNFDNWKSELSVIETLLVEQVCDQQMRAGGYALSDAGRFARWAIYPLTALLRIFVVCYVAIKGFSHDR